MECILLIAVIVLCGLIYSLWWNRKKLISTIESMNQALMSTTRMDFENDINTLRFLITYKIRVLDNQIRLSKIGNREYIYEFNNEKERIVTSVYMDLSPIYKSVLMKYFNEKGLLLFISYSVYMELIDVFRRNNLGTPTTISDWVKEHTEEENQREELQF